MAHKKGQGSSRNGRDSQSQRRGIKVYGGEIVDATSPTPNEIRGPSIHNGTSVQVSTGDVIHFAAGTPHQWLVAPGHQITYLVVHIQQPR